MAIITIPDEGRNTPVSLSAGDVLKWESDAAILYSYVTMSTGAGGARIDCSEVPGKIIYRYGHDGTLGGVYQSGAIQVYQADDVEIAGLFDTDGYQLEIDLDGRPDFGILINGTSGNWAEAPFVSGVRIHNNGDFETHWELTTSPGFHAHGIYTAYCKNAEINDFLIYNHYSGYGLHEWADFTGFPFGTHYNYGISDYCKGGAFFGQTAEYTQFFKTIMSNCGIDNADPARYGYHNWSQDNLTAAIVDSLYWNCEPEGYFKDGGIEGEISVDLAELDPDYANWASRDYHNSTGYGARWLNTAPAIVGKSLLSLGVPL